MSRRMTTLCRRTLAPLCAILLLAGANAAARQESASGLSFELTDARRLITRDIGVGLLLRVVKDGSVSQPNFGWRIEVVRRPYRGSSQNLLYHSRRTLGAHPSQVYAWHVRTNHFPNVRELDVAGRPLRVRVELIDPVAEGEGADSRFVSGRVRITWGPKRGDTAAARDEEEPRFEQYRADVWAGRPAPLDLRSHPLARRYRTLVRQQQSEEGINFAGRYTLASVGCGTGCSVTAIVDARDGRAYFPRALDGWTNIVGDYDPPEGEEMRAYRADSRLLRLVGRPNIGRAGEERYGPGGIYYYEWTGARLRLVKFRRVGSYPEADPPPRRARRR